MQDIGAMMLGNLAWIGKQLGLFESLSLCGSEGATAEELAEVSGCNARYIQEWLCAMASAEWVLFERGSRRFILPAEHAYFLVKKDHAGYSGGILDVVQPMALVAPKIMDCFKNGGGVSCDNHHPDIGKLIDGLTGPSQTYMTTELVKNHFPDVHEKLCEGIRVGDVGCGTGRALAAFARAYPNSTFVGFEPHRPSALQAQENISNSSLQNASVVVETSRALQENSFDFIMTWDVVHDVSDPAGMLADIFKGLKSDGVYLMNEPSAQPDFADNLARPYTFLWSISTMYCMTASLAGGGPGYGAFMGPDIAKRLCHEAGFSAFEVVEGAAPVSVFRVTK